MTTRSTRPTTDELCCQHLRSIFSTAIPVLRFQRVSHRLQGPACRLATVGWLSLPVAASILSNSLPPDIQSSSSLIDVSHRLQTHLFHQSLPDILLKVSTHRLRFRGLSNDACYSSHVKNSDLILFDLTNISPSV